MHNIKEKTKMRFFDKAQTAIILLKDKLVRRDNRLYTYQHMHNSKKTQMSKHKTFLTKVQARFCQAVSVFRNHLKGLNTPIAKSNRKPGKQTID